MFSHDNVVRRLPYIYNMGLKVTMVEDTKYETTNVKTSTFLIWSDSKLIARPQCN